MKQILSLASVCALTLALTACASGTSAPSSSDGGSLGGGDISSSVADSSSNSGDALFRAELVVSYIVFGMGGRTTKYSG